MFYKNVERFFKWLKSPQSNKIVPGLIFWGMILMVILMVIIGISESDSESSGWFF